MLKIKRYLEEKAKKRQKKNYLGHFLKGRFSERSWRIPVEEIEARNYDLKAVNLNRKKREFKNTQELLSITESQSDEIKM